MSAVLVLTRKEGETVVTGNAAVPGTEVTFTVLAIEGSKVRVGIDAPRDTTILRGELVERARAA